MTIVGIMVTAGLVLVVARPLLRRLGLPAGATGAVAWGALVLALGLALAAIRGSRNAVPSTGGPVGTGLVDDGVQVLVLVLLLVLAMVGRRWLSARLSARGQDHAAPRMRRRALPPAPNFPPDGNPPA